MKPIVKDVRGFPGYRRGQEREGVVCDGVKNAGRGSKSKEIVKIHFTLAVGAVVGYANVQSCPKEVNRKNRLLENC